MTRCIEMRDAGKRFTKYVDTPMLVTAALHLRSSRREKIWAVRDVDLDIDDGESFGVIGRNGSGKSTLMSMMAGITAPTSGSVRVWGRIAPLISVGVGFHRELTGRENVYVNGSILGISRTRIDALLEEIIDFSGVEEFIDTPVKFYSSGMFVRLGFAVAVHSRPDVLIVDEVLAVGDLAFQVKCHEKMQELRREGTTIVLVSHHLGLVRRVCDRVMLLDAGAVRHVGAPESAIAAFHEVLSATTEVQVDPDSALRFEPNVIHITSVDVAGADGRTTGHVECGEQLTVTIRTHAWQDVDRLSVAMSLFAADGTPVYSDSTVDSPFGAVASGDDTVFTVRFTTLLTTGSYSLSVRIDRPDLQTTLAHFPPCSFFVTGRSAVSGLADLQAEFGREDAGGPRDDPTGWSPTAWEVSRA